MQDILKFYFYAKETRDGPLYMVEMSLSTDNLNCTAVFRTEASEKIFGFQKRFQEALSDLRERTPCGSVDL